MQNGIIASSSVSKYSSEVVSSVGCNLDTHLGKNIATAAAAGDLAFQFLIFCSFSMQLIVNKWIKFRRWLDSNSRPLVSEVTALPTEPQPLPIYIFCSLSITTELGYECTVVKHIPVANYRWDSNPVHSCFESNAFTTEAQFILLPTLYERLHFNSYLNISSWLI